MAEEDTYMGLVVESDSEFSESEDEGCVLLREPFFSIVVIVLYVGIGTVVLCYLEGFAFTTALYIQTQVTTTVGYGDVTENTWQWKVFMVWYIIFGIAIVANVLNSVFSYFLDKSMEHARETMKSVEHSLGEGVHIENEALRRSRRMFTVSALILLVMILIWATVFQIVEPCSCSYGRTYIDGCLEDSYDQCVKTGGTVKDWGSNVYFAIVTFSTVGFGDYSLQSRLGRAISIVLMPMGVLAFLNFVTSISAVIGAYKDHSKKAATSAAQILRWIDKDHSGTLDEHEFMVYYLLKENIIQKDDMDQIKDLFNKLDKKDVGALSFDADALTIEGIAVSDLHAH